MLCSVGVSPFDVIVVSWAILSWVAVSSLGSVSIGLIASTAWGVSVAVGVGMDSLLCSAMAFSTWSSIPQPTVPRVSASSAKKYFISNPPCIRPIAKQLKNFTSTTDTPISLEKGGAT